MLAVLQLPATMHQYVRIHRIQQSKLKSKSKEIAKSNRRTQVCNSWRNSNHRESKWMKKEREKKGKKKKNVHTTTTTSTQPPQIKYKQRQHWMLLAFLLIFSLFACLLVFQWRCVCVSISLFEIHCYCQYE